MAATRIRVHPAIGIARLGNSPEEFFIGPERPGSYPGVDEYRDSQQRLKRQGARFRLFEYRGEADKLIKEINMDDPRVKSIRWTVHLVNSKAAGRFFRGILHPKSRLRNQRHSRGSLILDGKATSIEGINQKREIYCKTFARKKFPEPLKLGTLRTDNKGRLIVLGGHGLSGSLVHSRLNKRTDDFANHNNWYDDTSDGSVCATIFWKRGHKVSEAVAGWVIVAPPKYAPSLESVVTLYDVLYQKALDEELITTERQTQMLAPKARPSFRDDIFSILRRAYEMKWAWARAEVGHEKEIDLDPRRFSRDDMRKLERRAKHIVDQFREPSGHPKKPGPGTGRMPYIWSDLYEMDAKSNSPLHPVNATLTRYQFDAMKAWAQGGYDRDWPPARRKKKQITPEGLDRAALEACVGAAFYPGIETSFHIRDKFKYAEPFRLDPASVKPGQVTRQMSLPWQTDFVDCSDGDKPLVWWPAQRPIDVRTKPKTDPVRWARSFEKGIKDLRPEGMVKHWWRLGLLRRTKQGVFESHRVDDAPRASKRKKPDRQVCVQ